MLSHALNDVHGGVGIIYKVGIKKFVIRTGIIGATLLFSGIYFYHAYIFIKYLPVTNRVLINYYEVIFVMFLSLGAWLPYHIARILFHHFASKLIKWKSVINNEDVIFIVLFVLVFLILLIGFILLFSILE